MEFWGSVSEAQATIIGGFASGALTVMAAIVGVLMGSRLFQGKVVNLTGALQEADTRIQKHSQIFSSRAEEIRASMETVNRMEESIRLLKEQVPLLAQDMKNVSSEMNIIISSVAETVNQVRGRLTDSESIPSSVISDEAADGSRNGKQQIREDWGQIRDWLEHVASDQNIDGRTRAKYSRIDRRSYGYLIDVLDYDGMLDGKGDEVRRALEIWNKYKMKSIEPSLVDIEHIDNIRQSVLKS